MVTIITVNFNQTALTCALLESIRQQEFQDIEVIVVDNASVENPEKALLACYPGLIFIQNSHNLGFAGANNRACAVATGSQLFFVNNDAEITPGCIARLQHLRYRASPRRAPSAGRRTFVGLRAAAGGRA